MLYFLAKFILNECCHFPQNSESLQVLIIRGRRLCTRRAFWHWWPVILTSPFHLGGHCSGILWCWRSGKLHAMWSSRIDCSGERPHVHTWCVSDRGMTSHTLVIRVSHMFNMTRTADGSLELRQHSTKLILCTLTMLLWPPSLYPPQT